MAWTDGDLGNIQLATPDVEGGSRNPVPVLFCYKPANCRWERLVFTDPII